MVIKGEKWDKALKGCVDSHEQKFAMFELLEDNMQGKIT